MRRAPGRSRTAALDRSAPLGHGGSHGVRDLWITAGDGDRADSRLPAAIEHMQDHRPAIDQGQGLAAGEWTPCGRNNDDWFMRAFQWVDGRAISLWCGQLMDAPRRRNHAGALIYTRHRREDEDVTPHDSIEVTRFPPGSGRGHRLLPDRLIGAARPSGTPRQTSDRDQGRETETAAARRRKRHSRRLALLAAADPVVESHVQEALHRLPHGK